MLKMLAQSTSNSLLETAIYNTDLDKNLTKNLRSGLAGIFNQEIFGRLVKPLDENDIGFINNTKHKLAAALTGCISAEIAKNDCESAALGAMIGEMWADRKIDNPNTLTDKQRQQIINESRLAASFAAFIFDKDINTAANMASEAAKWNATGKHPQQFRNTKQEIFGEGSVVAQFGDMIIVNVSGSIYGYTVVVNAKNGKVFATDKFEVSASTSIVSGAETSINFGKVIDGNYSAKQLDGIITGSSFNVQACYGVCAGISKTRRNTIVTYGLGTPQVGMSGGSLKYTGLTLSSPELKQLILKGR
ncbi:Possible hemagglutinin (DUF637) [Moraxella cuniculi]|uniref:Possible hemagglutinin (DUF637) n=2 Tax=Moraxella cuniculi TaxID=34061 RepID=A0A3S4R494_9GAMM|nr:Possible hemagglutinin (DUF637) [Moraxella cuniculi]